MYKLIKIFGARTNVPEPLRIPLAANATVCRDMPVHIKNGILTTACASSQALPTHVTLAACDGNEVLCYAISPDMVFEIPVCEAPHAMNVGSEYLLSADGSCVTATAVSGSLRGATLMNKNGAAAAGDNILVAFR